MFGGQEALSESFSNLGLDDFHHANSVKLALTNIALHKKVDCYYKYMSSNDLRPHLITDPFKSTNKALNYKNLGNEAFCSGLYIQALQLYTKSVAAAPPDSPELAIAYANRSAALFRLERYEACLVDINRALGSNYPEDLKSKLVARKTNCVSKLSVRNAANLNYWVRFL